MKRIAYVLAVWIGCLALFVQCGEEPELPVMFHMEKLSAPTDLTSAFQDALVLTWNMPETTNVVRYIVSVSDSSGVIYEGFADSTYVELGLALEDSVLYYLQVRAVDADCFEGPVSEVDTLLVH